MVFELILGFLVLVAASYVGTTMALRGFFGRERYDSTAGTDSDGPPDNEDAPGTGESRGSDGPSRTDDVPRAGDAVDDADDG